MAATACVGWPPPTWWAHGTSFGGQDSKHIVGGDCRTPRAQVGHPFSQAGATTCTSCGHGRDGRHHHARCRHGRHHQCTLTSLAKACYCNRPAHVGLAALPVPVPTSCAAIFVQGNFLCFLKCFQLGNLKISHIWVFDATLEVLEFFDPSNYFSQFTAFFILKNYKKK